MSDDIFIAYERALGLFGVDVWENLPDPIRTRILNAEIARLAADRAPTVKFQTQNDRARE